MKRFPYGTIGLTGGMGSGKSTVARLFSAHGYSVLDADQLTRIVHADADVQAALVHQFGADVVQGREVVRARLAARAFETPDKMRALNAIMQPALAQKARECFETLPKPVVLDAPLLIEMGWNAFVEVTIVVLCPLHTRLERIAVRDNISKEQALARIQYQCSDIERIQCAHFLIYNCGSYAQLEHQCAPLF